jgi:S1-C subfamily serine protease
VPGLSAPAIRLAERTPDTGELALIVGRSWGGHLKARLTTLTRVDGPIRVGRGRTLERVLNLDTTPYTGFSGSAVLLPDGAVAGISTTGLLRGAGLALTSDTIRPILDALERHGSVKRGFVGITSQSVAIPEAQRAGGAGEHGLLVIGVAPGTPAAKAGLLVGDILVAFAGTPVGDPEQLLGHLTGNRVGTEVPLTLVRGRDAIELPVTIGERPVRT